ncbi:response regulator transcription factor [Paenibacillus sp. 2TAB19]|uniref:response regulator transcription factor n=1 Tax=Paenibacillus sp. 2TAB19 TaxID=3233003 RepID=UPI003F94D9FD
MRDEVIVKMDMDAVVGASMLGTAEAGLGGVLCSLTKRVMIISPLPERVKGLLITLSAECFDVFSLHDFDSSMLQSLKPELLVYDAIPVTRAGSSNTLQDGAALIEFADRSGVPVLVLTDQQSSNHNGEAALGGAELLVWPASPDEALNRINQMLMNRPTAGVSDETIAFKDIRVDKKKMTVVQGTNRIDLTKTEYDLLLFFLTSDGSVLTRESMLDTVWGLQFYGGSNVVDVHIKSLRKKLKDSAVAPKYIVTVRGVGYRLAD